MRVSNLRTVPRTGGWLTDSLKVVQRLLPGQQPTTINVQAPAASTPGWVLPAILVGGGVIAVAMFTGRRRK